MSKKATASIDLSKINDKLVFTSEKSGHRFLNIVLWFNDEPDKYGNNFSIQQQTGPGDDKIYLGNGKFYEPK